MIEALEQRQLLNASLVAAYHLDEGSGQVIFDSSANANSAYLSETGVNWEAPGYGGAGSDLAFDGTGGYADLGNPSALNFSGAITLSAWVKPLSTDGIQDVIAHGYTTSPSNAEVFLRVDKGQYEVGSWDGTVHWACAPIPAGDLGTSVHLAGEYDGTGWRLYRDGQFAASQNDTVGSLPVSADWTIGSDALTNPTDPRAFDGSIDEVRIDDTALTAGEIQGLAAATPVAPPSGLTATAQSTTEINLAWTDNSAGATAEQVWKTPDGINWSLAATLAGNATTFSDTTLTEATQEAYEVCAIAPDPTGLSSTGSASSGFASPAFEMTLPAAPTNLTATASGGGVALAWSDHSQAESGYGIYRSLDGTTFTLVDSVAPDVTSYDDLAAPDGSADYYEVRALDDGGESAPTPVASATPVLPLVLADDPAVPPWGQSRMVYTIAHGQTMNASAGDGVLTNDVDPNGWTLTVASHSNPAHGTLTLNSDGSFTYAANNNFTGQDSFTYTATDDINAPANTATVTINVTDLMPQANWQMLYLAQAQDSHGNNLAYAASLSGSLLGNDPDQDPLTWSLVSGPQAGQGTFSFDSNTGSFTFTPPQNSTMSTATVIVKANDGALDSNLATIIFPGYNIPTGGTINSVGLASPGLGDSFGVGENGTLQVAAPGLLNEAQDPYSSNPPTLGGMIAGPQHGTLSVNSADGSFVYQPNPGFVGEDFFTCEILGQNGSAGYKTDFVTVDPTTVGLSFDSLAPGDPSALIPSEQVQPPVNGSPAFATLYLNTVEPQVTGTSLTLSVNSDVVADIDVYDGIPGQSGTNLLFGADNGLSSATWTIGPNLVALPSQVYVVGLNPTTYDQAVFTLSLTLGVQTQWAPASPPSAPATQPVVAAQKGTVPGLKGHLVAFDGSGDSQQDNTDISQFLTADDGVQNFYEPGVGNPHDTPFGKLRYSTIAFGDAEAMVFERDALREVQTFYSDPKNIHIPLDVIGYSRGAFEAVKLINNVFNDGTGIGDLRYKRTTRTLGIPTGTTYDGHYLHPQVRFVGLISPVMGPMRVPFLWSESLPPGVTSMYQALDNFPNDDFLPQVTMTRSAGTGGDPDIQYPLAHTVIGKDPKVEADMVAAAKGVGVQLK